jgi:hypothetical protein
MAVIYPVIGDWYRRPGGNLFEVVAVDDEDGTVDVQHFDGTVEEIDLEVWPEIIIEAVEAPEDWSGAIDIEADDFYAEATGNGSHTDWETALDQLDIDRA